MRRSDNLCSTMCSRAERPRRRDWFRSSEPGAGPKAPTDSSSVDPWFEFNILGDRGQAVDIERPKMKAALMHKT